jgi:hypothetical protein
MSHRRASLAGVLAIGAMSLWLAARQSSPAEPGSGMVAVESKLILLNPQDRSQTTVGDFHYAGGVAITARDTDQLHGISDLEIAGNDRLVAVTDFGSLITARLVFDAGNRLTDLADVRITQLRDEDGTLPADKADVDAEGIALLPNGDRLVSFERRHRILLYPSGGDRPRRVPAPDEAFPANGGMEALGADPDAGDEAYIVGAEVTGATWSCQVNSTCRQGPTVDMPEGFGLVAMRRLPGSRSVYLLRAYDVARGSRVLLQIVASGKVAAQLDLAPPLTVDNYEGVAAVPGSDGGFRFYLVSDDNASASQRTLLLAFDWRPR